MFTGPLHGRVFQLRVLHPEYHNPAKPFGPKTRARTSHGNSAGIVLGSFQKSEGEPPSLSYYGNIFSTREDYIHENQQEAQANYEGCGEPWEESKGQTPVAYPRGLAIAEKVDDDPQNDKSNTDEKVNAWSHEIEGFCDQPFHPFSP